MKRSSRWNIAIVGAGKVGLVLGRILVGNGERVVAVISRSRASAKRAGGFLRCRNISTSLSAIPPTIDIIFITTPHGVVAETADKLSRLSGIDFRRVAVCHASGMLTADVLKPLRRRGATVFSFHPLQTFPRDFDPADIVESARGIYFGVDGSPAALKIARRFARKLGGHILGVPPSRRVLYHAACVLASNHLVTMLGILEQMFKNVRSGQSGFYTPFEPIVMATLRNVARTSPAKALSGPVARGGVETIAGHFASLRRFAPGLVPYYAHMSLETVKLAHAKGSLTREQTRSLKALLHTYLTSTTSPEVTI